MRFKWVAQLLAVINGFRKENGLNGVSFNYTVYEHLNELRNTHGDHWFYDFIPNKSECHYVSMIGRTQCNVGDFIMPLGFNHLFHDTHKIKNNILPVIRYRINQMSCLDFEKCDRNQFNDHITCLKDGITVRNQDGLPIPNFVSKKCLWNFYYTPRLLYPSTTQISCILLDFETPYVPEDITQLYSFYCYANHKYPQSDHPFDN